MGGDELDLIVPGSNYGWPDVSLGVDYVDPVSDEKFWPPSAHQGRHPGFSAPLFAWTPSIAPSSLQFIDGFHPRWDGDLLVSALAGRR